MRKDDSDCVSLIKGSTRGVEGPCRRGELERRKCEKSWGWKLISVGAGLLNPQGAGDFVRDPIMNILVPHVEVFRPITLIKLKLMRGSARDLQKVCFIGSYQLKKNGLKCKPTASLR